MSGDEEACPKCGGTDIEVRPNVVLSPELGGLLIGCCAFRASLNDSPTEGMGMGKAYTPWSDEEIAILDYEAERGRTNLEIASLVERSRWAVKYQRERRGLPAPSRKRKEKTSPPPNPTKKVPVAYSKAKSNNSLKFYRQGFGIDKVAKAAGIGNHTVSHHIKPKDKEARWKCLVTPHCQPPCRGDLEPTKKIRQGRREWRCQECRRVYRFPLRGEVFG